MIELCMPQDRKARIDAAARAVHRASRLHHGAWQSGDRDGLDAANGAYAAAVDHLRDVTGVGPYGRYPAPELESCEDDYAARVLVWVMGNEDGKNYK